MSFALDHDVVVDAAANEVGGIEVEVQVDESVVDSVVIVDSEVVKDVRSNWTGATVAPDGDDVKVEEVEDSHVVGQLCASQVHFVNIVDVEKNDGTVVLLLLLQLQLFQ